jgi:hypothetical protein
MYESMIFFLILQYPEYFPAPVITTILTACHYFLGFQYFFWGFTLVLVYNTQPFA